MSTIHFLFCFVSISVLKQHVNEPRFVEGCMVALVRKAVALEQSLVLTVHERVWAWGALMFSFILFSMV